MPFFTLDQMELVPPHWHPAFPRTADLLAALRCEPDFDLIEARVLRIADEVLQECLIVDVVCDGVPGDNRPGIKYPERLALVVGKDERRLVEVFALRTDFPTLPHMNSMPPGCPLSLCLYFGSVTAILRTWTAPKFLRRIQWWLTQAAQETLHAADQPVEQLFYVTQHELVFPHDFADLCQRPGAEFFITGGEPRPDGAQTLMLQAAPQGKMPLDKAFTPIILNVPPVLQGPIERVPTTLGALVDVMARRGNDILPMLRQAFIDRMPETGLTREECDHPVVLVLSTPIVREKGGQPEKEQHQAFIFKSKWLAVGDRVGAYFSYDNRYFAEKWNPKLETGATAAWRDEPLSAIEVKFFNSQAQARQQSGLTEAGPRGALIGVGALGSALLDLWSRSGWGQWHIVDHDHIKPHNLVRHRAFAQQVGMAKVDAVKELHEAVTRGAVPLSSVHADAALLEPPVLHALQHAQLVVDATSGLDFPRSASRQEGVGRHVSVFLTPDGNGAVLLAEDVAREIPLLALEGQYYRAIINTDWGRDHLTGHLGTYWSGASCRDISFSLPYSRVLVHAACLAEQVQRCWLLSESCMRVWQRDPRTGSVILHEIPSARARGMRYGDMTVLLDEGLEQKLFGMRSLQAPNETGGILLGYYDLIEKILMIVDACPAPPDSVSTPASFQRGTEGVAERVNEVSRLTADIVGYVGEWHSHPPGVPASPSGDDLLQLAQLALGMAEDGLPAISLIVGEKEVAIFQGAIL